MNPRAWSWPRLAAAGIAFYLVFLVVTLPAAWVDELLSRATRGQARLLGTQGNFWQGSGTMVFNAAGGTALQNRVHWNIRPFWLLIGKLRADIKSEGDITLQAIVTAGYRQLRLQDLAGEFAASHAQAFYPPAMLVSPTGQIKVAGNDVELGHSGFSGELRLTWTGAGSKLGAAGELGDYALIATGQNGTAQLRIETLRGDVRIDARGAWQANTDGALTLDGTLLAGSREAMLAPLLAALNVRKDGDRYPLRLQGRITPWFAGSPG